ncbi:hypothetical protein LTR74_015484 [Friedmanniomyces endolithicus]|nr:hypothetical protein LTR74_015484 [Friedmanniomyces endolithicus]
MSGALGGDGAGDGGGGCVAGPEYGKKVAVVVNTEEVEVEDEESDGDDTPLRALIRPPTFFIYLPTPLALPFLSIYYHLISSSSRVVLCAVHQSAYTTIPADADADADPAHPCPPSEQQDRDDSSRASSHTLPVDEREGPEAASADYERLGSGPTAAEEGEEGEEEEEEDMGPPRRRRDAFGAAGVRDLDLDSVYAAPTDEEVEGGDAGAGAVGGGGVGAGLLAEPSSGAGGGPDAGQGTGLSVLETVRQFRSLDYTSSSGSSAAAAAPHATRRRDDPGLDTDTSAVTDGGIRGFRTRLRHQPGVANFLRPLDNNPADRSQALNLDGGVATPDTATLAEVNGSLSDVDENWALLSLQWTWSSKYRYKGKGKEAVYNDPQDVDRDSIASSTASAEPRRKQREREPGEPFGHLPESSRDAVATPPADEPIVNTSSLQSESSRDAIATFPANDPILTTPSPLSLPEPDDHQTRAGPRDAGGVRDPGHWSLAPRDDAATNTAAEEATRMTVEWLRRSDAEGTSPVDRREGARQEWEVGLRGPMA